MRSFCVNGIHSNVCVCVCEDVSKCENDVNVVAFAQRCDCDIEAMKFPCTNGLSSNTFRFISLCLCLRLALNFRFPFLMLARSLFLSLYLPLSLLSTWILGGVIRKATQNDGTAARIMALQSTKTPSNTKKRNRIHSIHRQ